MSKINRYTLGDIHDVSTYDGDDERDRVGLLEEWSEAGLGGWWILDG